MSYESKKRKKIIKRIEKKAWWNIHTYTTRAFFFAAAAIVR
jgi:hypothetical protein